MHIMGFSADDVLRVPAQDFRARRITECGPALVIQPVNPFPGCIEDQLVFRAQTLQFFQCPVEFLAAGGGQVQIRPSTLWLYTPCG